MHILFLDTERTWRGGENQMRLLIEGLLAQNVSCSAVLQPGGEAAKRLCHTLEVFEVSMSGGFDPIAAFKIAQLCRNRSIDLIDAQTSNAHSLALLVKKLYPKLKLVVHRRVDYQPKSGFINRAKYLSNDVDRYIAISNAISRILSDYGIPKEKLTTVRSAVNPSRYDHISPVEEKLKWCQRYSIDPQCILLGNASALTSQKGYEVLIESLYYVRKEFDHFHCLIAGKGELKETLVKQCRDLHMQDKISFIGWTDEVESFLSALDILAIPSNYEGLGTVILEGIYAGCCVVSSDAGGIVEMIKNGETGLTAPVGNVSQYVKQLLKACQSQSLRLELNLKARQFCMNHFSLEKMIEGNYQVFNEIIKNYD